MRFLATTYGGWNERLVESLFNDQEANLIKKMPLFQMEGVDKLIWWRSCNGIYTMQSAYYGIMEDLTDIQHLRKPGNWMLIWRLKVPSKVKLMLGGWHENAYPLE